MANKYYEIASINTHGCKEITVKSTRTEAEKVAQDKISWGHAKVKIEAVDEIKIRSVSI